MQRTIFTIRFVSDALRGLSRVILMCAGWSVIGSIPPTTRKCVIIAAPHTSNWDFPILFMAALLLRVNAQWIGKHTLFRFPFAGMMKFLGGIPVNRERSNNLVNTYVHQFAIAHNEFRLAIAPEGTRKQVTRWKTGFYHIAVIAQVPIVLGFIDYKTKRCGIAGIFYPTGDIDIDIASIQSYYASFRGRR